MEDRSRRCSKAAAWEGSAVNWQPQPPSYLKANPIKIIILTSAPHQACLDDTSTQAKRTSICQCFPIVGKGSTFNRIDRAWSKSRIWICAYNNIYNIVILTFATRRSSSSRIWTCETVLQHFRSSITLRGKSCATVFFFFFFVLTQNGMWNIRNNYVRLDEY